MGHGLTPVKQALRLTGQAELSGFITFWADCRFPNTVFDVGDFSRGDGTSFSISLYFHCPISCGYQFFQYFEAGILIPLNSTPQPQHTKFFAN